MHRAPGSPFPTVPPLLRLHLSPPVQRVAALYEVVVFTASQAKYADPLLDLLDPGGALFSARLFREACVRHGDAFVKDLSLLGRDLAATIICDNSPASYLFHPENALPCGSFIDDPADAELWALAEFLEAIADVEVRALQQYVSRALVAHGRCGAGRGKCCGAR